MVDEHVEKAVHDVLRCAQAACGRPAQSEVTIRCAMVDAIPPSLDWRAWLPWKPQPESALGRRRRSGNALFERSGEPTVFIQTTRNRLRMDSANAMHSISGWARTNGGELAQQRRDPWHKPRRAASVTCRGRTVTSTIPA